ncbi:uncharacterized protein V1510DRAFT_304633 [Dipodascopsis tothii]|uniref:uncharacterized protein n=1 Tax=Dipodascopsis tothii TaxID=44089 RepID=UPI0034CEF125
MMSRMRLGAGIGRAVTRTPARALSGSAAAASESPSSTSALAYKLHRRHFPSKPRITTPTWSASSAVSSILYETPLPTEENPSTSHVLNCLVQNEPGVLSRVAGILAARGFNIDSLVVCNTEVENLSRMTIVLRGKNSVIEQARRQLEDLVPVWAVLDYTNTPIVQRELLLAKVTLLGPEYFEDLLAHHEAGGATADAAERPDEPFHPASLPASEALRQKHQHLDAITKLAAQFGGKINHISSTNCIVELCAKPERLSDFIQLLQPFGILELARSGRMVLTRTPLEGAEKADVASAEEIVDLTQLPPG